MLVIIKETKKIDAIAKLNTSVRCVCARARVSLSDIVVNLNSGVRISGEYIHDREKITWIYMTGSTKVNSALSILYAELESQNS